MSRIKMLSPLVPMSSGRTVQVEPKRVDPHYLSPEHKQWRETVLRNAGYRCEAIEDGKRCTRAAPAHRLFADHKVELKDSGAAYDPANGECLCGSHHTRKTAMARKARASMG